MVKINTGDTEFDIAVGQCFVVKKGAALPLPEEGHRFRLTNEFRHGSPWAEYIYEISDWSKVKQEPLTTNEGSLKNNWYSEYHKIKQDWLRDQSKKQEQIDNLRESNKALRLAIAKLNEKIECLIKANDNQANTIDSMREQYDNQAKTIEAYRIRSDKRADIINDLLLQKEKLNERLKVQTDFIETEIRDKKKAEAKKFLEAELRKVEAREAEAKVIEEWDKKEAVTQNVSLLMDRSSKLRDQIDSLRNKFLYTWVIGGIVLAYLVIIGKPIFG